MLKIANPSLVIKVIDACNSGVALIKSDEKIILSEKGELRDLIQIAACLDTQNSPAGDPISPFTEKFCLAATRKEEGPVYYLDIIATLKDQYLDNPMQVPHFTFQGTSRDVFVNDATVLSEFKVAFREKWMGKPPETGAVASPAPAAPSLLEMLHAVEAGMAAPERVEAIADSLFDALIRKTSMNEVTDVFEIGVHEHSDYTSYTSRGFLLRTLLREKRPDHFVTTPRIQKAKRNPLATFGMMQQLYEQEDPEEVYEIKLNMPLKRAEVSIYLTPKFRSLKQIGLAVTLVPSLEHYYVFEMLTERALKTWDQYDYEGAEIERRWYKRRWDQQVDGVVESICSKLKDVVADRLQSLTQKLAGSA